MLLFKKSTIDNSWLYYILIVLFGMNFLGRGSICCLVFGLFALWRTSRRIVLDRCALCTLCFAVLSFLASTIYFGLEEAIKCFNSFLMYILGLNGLYASRNRREYLEKTLFSIFLGYALLVCLTYFNNLRFAQDVGRRVIRNFWTGESMSVTLIGLLSSVVIGYFFYGLWCQKSKILKALCVVAMIVVFLVNNQTATRTPFVLFLLVTVFMWSVYIQNQKSRKAFRLIASIIALAIVCAGLYIWDAWGIRSYVEETAIFERFMMHKTDTSRTDLFWTYLEHMLDYPWGGSRINSLVGRSAHNWLQQGYDLYGVFAAIALLGIVVFMLKNVCVLMALKEKNSVDYLLLSMYVAMIVQAFLEPIFTGYPCFFFSMLLLHGIATAYIKKRNEIANENC